MLLTTTTFLKSIFHTVIFAVASLFSRQHPITQENTIPINKAYFLTASGNDANDGSKNKPWKTIAKLNSILLSPGDTVYFEGGQTFGGSILIDAGDAGSSSKPIQKAQLSVTKH